MITIVEVPLLLLCLSCLLPLASRFSESDLPFRPRSICSPPTRKCVRFPFHSRRARGRLKAELPFACRPRRRNCRQVCSVDFA